MNKKIKYRLYLICVMLIFVTIAYSIEPLRKVYRSDSVLDLYSLESIINDVYLYMTEIDTDIDSIYLSTSTLLKNIHRQDITTNTENQVNQTMRKGWGYIAGNNTTRITGTITFGITYDEFPIVYVAVVGAHSTTPTGINSFVTAAADTPTGLTACVTSVWAITTTGCNVDIIRTGGLDSTWVWGYSWIAIGTKR